MLTNKQIRYAMIKGKNERKHPELKSSRYQCKDILAECEEILKKEGIHDYDAEIPTALLLYPLKKIK